jgi:putative hydrolase of the HAD superfamily
MDQEIDFVFFDIGKTLGEPDAEGHFQPYASSARLLRDLRNKVSLRIGIITTLPEDMSDSDAEDLLRDAGLFEYLDPSGFVSNRKAGATKPDPRIYRFAAQQCNLPIGRCLYIGESLVEVIGAIAAGMKAVLKPSPPGRELVA